VELASATPPQLILLDLGMPGTDGYATAALLRERLGERTPPLVAVSGFGAPSDHRRTAAASFSAHLTKPVDPDLLLSTIARLTRPSES
jgi:CheY-like chemotaxis protein